jgi:DNA polymerase III delta prime subunit
MKLEDHFAKELHHAYLIEGNIESTLIELIEILKRRGIKAQGGDLYNISLDTFKIEDARNLNNTRSEKNFNANSKKVFIISANNFLLEAQNSLLKLFEEPIPNTHFFIITPSTSALLKTFKSRFYIIKKKEEEIDSKDAEKFMKMSYLGRLDYVKKVLDEEEGARTKALEFLNSLEFTLSKKPLDADLLHHIFHVRQFLRIPGSSAKMLLESVALSVPVLK